MAEKMSRTVKLFRIEDDGRRIAAGTINATTPAELVAKWQAFLATADDGVYVARYRGESLGTAAAADVRP
jgi:hypothetical protein